MSSIPITRWREIWRAASGRACLTLIQTSLHLSWAGVAILKKRGDLAMLASMVESEQFRTALGRIACGYDGGQIIEE